MKVPFETNTLSRQLLTSKETDLGLLEVFAVPSWPCFAKDGAGIQTNIYLEMIITTKHGVRYQLTEIEND